MFLRVGPASCYFALMAMEVFDREFFVKSGRKGAAITNRKLTPKQRKESAKKAAQARWSKTLNRIDTLLDKAESRAAAQARQKKARAKKRLGANLRD